jgi:PAS domain S-box-containing protein
VEASTVIARDAAAWLAAVVDSSNDPIVSKTLDGEITAWNRAAEQIFGYTAEEAIGRHIWLIVPPTLRAEHAEILDRLRAGQRIAHFETVRRTRDGRDIEVSVTISPIRGPDGQLVGASKILREIGERRRIEAALRQSEARFRTLAEQAPVGIFQTGPEGGCEFVNRAWTEVTGLSEAEAAGDRWIRALHPDDRERVARLWRETAETGALFTAEYRFLRADGRITWVVGSAAALREGERTTGYIGTLADVTARRLGEDALRDREAMLHMAQAAAHAGVWAWDPTTDTSRWSAECHALYGTDPETFVPSLHGWASRLVPEDRDRALAQVLRAAETGEEVTLEFRIMHPEGGLRWLWERAHMQRRGGAGARMAGIVLDITERKLAEEDLRRSERLYRGIGESIDYGMWICDPDGRCTYASQSFLDLIGMTQEACDAMGWVAALHRDDAAQTAEAWQACARSGGPRWEREHRVRGRDGQWHFVLARGVPIRDDAGTIVCWAGIHLDITRLKRAEEVARTSEARLRVALRAASAGVWQLEVATGDLSFSDELLVLYGYEAAMPRRLETWLASVHPDDRERIESDLRRCLTSDTEEFRQEMRIFHPIHGERAILHTGRVERDARGNALRMTGIHLDITERVAAEAALRLADRRKDEFLATLAHELRNPLAPIVNGLQLLRMQGVASTMSERALGMMERQVDQMVRLVDDLLEISRITRGVVELRREYIDIADVVASAVETSRPLVESRGHRLDIDVSQAPMWVYADAMRLAQVLTNLLGNAAKYTDDGGRIHLAARRESGEIAIAVRDDGIGIPRALLPRVFDLFAQVDRARQSAQGGLGIGLSLARSLVELHGGRIEARSDGPGAGSEFVVHLPAAPLVSDASPAGDTRRAASQSKEAPRRVLVVDDNTDAADSLAGLLRMRGHKVEIAYDGRSAVALARARPPEVVVLDIGLPGEDGYAIARRLRADPALLGTLLVALTGYGQAEDRRRSQEAGFDAHLVKPVVLAELDALLASGEPAPDA